mgnify:CR=1 FL=1
MHIHQIRNHNDRVYSICIGSIEDQYVPYIYVTRSMTHDSDWRVSYDEYSVGETMNGTAHLSYEEAAEAAKAVMVKFFEKMIASLA